jgi:predicted AAA+ superfamily ATPase
MLSRKDLEAEVRRALARSPVVALLGPRQCGKTTLARQLMRAGDSLFDLEDPASIEALRSPRIALERLSGVVVIDEVQRLPELFPVLRVLADRPESSTRFLLLGSAAPELVRGVSESLAGRVELVDMAGFDLDEVGAESQTALWWRGGFPRSFLATSDEDSVAWRENFVRTFLERDIPQLGIGVPALQLRRFWTMVAHYHGQTWNHAEVGSSLGVDEKTVRRYLDILAGAFMVRPLAPWFENVGKRQRKAPKVYLRDTGLLHTLLGIDAPDRLLLHPKLGASWEGFALEHIIRNLGTRDVYYWAVHSGPELDLLAFVGGRRIGFEFKYADAPRMTTSMAQARELLKLDRLIVVSPVNKGYALDETAEVVPLADLTDVIARMRSSPFRRARIGSRS